MASAETMENIEKVVDAVEDTLETVERIPKVNLNGTTKKQQVVILGLTAFSSAAAGGAIAYLVTKKRLELKFEELLAQEVAETKKFYAKLHKKDEFATPEAVLGAIDAGDEALEAVVVEIEEYTETVKDLGYGEGLGYNEDETPGPVPEEPEVVEASRRQNVFDNSKDSDDEWDYETELRERMIDSPYILHHDEYFQGELDYQQVTLTYFEGDDVLMDEKDQPISDTDDTVGDINLTRFGHGSKDKNIVYVRNDRLEVDFEIVRSTGEYTAEVLGFRHSDSSSKLRKFRSDDE